LAAAALFGLSAPLAKLLLPSVRPLMLAALLYLGGGTVLLFAGGRRSREAPPSTADVPLLVGVILLGGTLGPWLMLLGLERLSAVTGSLLLTLEGPFTVIVALLLFREHLGARSAVAAALVFVASALLAYQPGSLPRDGLGVLFILAACVAWAMDNNLSQRLSLKDPVQVVRLKALASGTLMLVLALLTGQRIPLIPVLALSVGVGAASYGLSIVLDMHALRLLGAAREAAYFATAPFIGALGAAVLLAEKPTPSDLFAGLLMATGVALLLLDRHSHLHTHEALEHEHLHVHDVHHTHSHANTVTEPHSHWHQHTPLTHDHPHVSDLHHRHSHR
jgi:drug/metabolite transporter (DMT)-like permease